MITAIILLIAVVFVLVLMHEWAHFVVARRNGITVEEFGIGFPPRLFSKVRHGVRYSLNLLPIGGYVKLKHESYADKSPGSFGAAKFGVQAKVLLAGVGANLIGAYLILLGLAITGAPRMVDHQFSFGHGTYSQPPTVMAAEVEAGSAAARADIRVGDLILSGNGQKFSREADLTNFTKSQAGRVVNLLVRHKGQDRTVTVHLGNDPVKGYLGVSPFLTSQIRYGWAAPIVAAGLFLQLLVATIKVLIGFFVGLFVHAKVSDQVTSPVGLAIILNGVLKLGAAYVFTIILSLSLALAVFNALPLPPLDGGRLATIGIARLFKLQLSDRTEAWLARVGYAFLLVIMIVVVYADIKRY